MNQFAAYLLDSMLERMLADEGNSWAAKMVARETRKRFKADPTTITGPVQEALDKAGLMLIKKPFARKKRKPHVAR